MNMVGIVLIGVLSGMIFGTLAVLLRRIALWVMLVPIVLAPAVYLVVWRDALQGHCFFASNFGGASCAPFREFLSVSLGYTGPTVVVLFTHLVVAFVVFITLRLARKGIATVDMKSPKQKEAERIAQAEAEAARQAYDEEVQRLTEELMSQRDGARVIAKPAT